MPDRFEVVSRLRYDVRKTCVKDNLTGALSVFVNAGNAERAAARLNEDHANTVGYIWTAEIGTPTFTPEGNKDA